MEALASIDINGATVLAGVVVANAAAIFGFFWGLSKKQIVHEMQIKQLQKDINNLGRQVRKEGA